MTSKSFRAALPNLGEEELQRLRSWAADNCAASSVFREDEAVIWLASRDRARSREAFLRSVRTTLRHLGVDVSRLRGRWLTLAEDCAVAHSSLARNAAQRKPRRTRRRRATTQCQSLKQTMSRSYHWEGRARRSVPACT